MKIKPKNYTLQISHEELVSIQLAIEVFLEEKITHKRWRKSLTPVSELMREILGMEDDS